MFKLKLNNRQPSDSELAKIYAQQAIHKKHSNEKLITEWLDNESDFDTTALIELWEQYRKKYGFSLTKEAIKTMAIANSVIDTNNFLARRMNMKEVAINIDDFNLLLGKLFIVNLSNLLVSETGLEQSAKTDIMQRIVARHFPNKEKQSSLSMPTFELQEVAQR